MSEVQFLVGGSLCAMSVSGVRGLLTLLKLVPEKVYNAQTVTLENGLRGGGRITCACCQPYDLVRGWCSR